MSEQDYVSVSGMPCTSAKVTVGYAGPWTAEVRLGVDGAIPDRCELKIGNLTLVGAPLREMDGTHALQRHARIVGGAAGWGRDVAKKGYHNDAGVKARLVVEDAAREVGEQLGTFIPTRERIGIDYARQAGPASRALIDAIGGAAWWVDYAGLTQVGPRTLTTPDEATYTVLAFNPAERTGTLTADDPSTIQVGAQISNGIDVPGIVRELEIVAGGEDKLRINIWLGGTAQDPGRLAGLMTTITTALATQRLFGVYRYRVVQQSGDDRVDLQAIETGLPDLRAISAWPGIPGARATITPGGEALVMFIGGDRAQPIVMGYAHYGAAGFAPVSLTLGGNSGEPAARKGDAVAAGGPLTLATFWPPLLPPNTVPPPAMICGTPYWVSFDGNKPTAASAAGLSGKVTTGSSIVKIAPVIPVPTP
jgi:hypothetical protein